MKSANDMYVKMLRTKPMQQTINFIESKMDEAADSGNSYIRINLDDLPIENVPSATAIKAVLERNNYEVEHSNLNQLTIHWC